MDAWGLKGAPAGPKPVLRGAQPTTRVVVLGGGLSGLIAAHELRKLDYDCRVLEARDWSGGLTWTVRRGAEHTEIGGERQVCDFAEGQYINAGALTVRGRIEHVLTQASKVHPQMREELEAAYCVWWEKVPYSVGAYGRTPSRACTPGSAEAEASKEHPASLQRDSRAEGCEEPRLSSVFPVMS